MGSIDRSVSCDSGEILCSCDRGCDLFGIVAVRTLDSIEDKHVAVITAGCKCVRVFSRESLLPVLCEFLGYGAHVWHFRSVSERGVAETFDRISADLDYFGIVHGIAAKDLKLGAKFSCLTHDDSTFGKVGRDVKDIGVLADYLCQLGSEILVAGVVVQLR